MALAEKEMARRSTSDSTPPDGSVLAENLIRLGYAETVVRTTEIARLVSEKTGKPMSRQRIANLLNAINIRQETIDQLAKGLGVDPKELMKRPGGPPAKGKGGKG